MVSNLSGLPNFRGHQLKLLKPYLTFIKPGSPEGAKRSKVSTKLLR